MNTRIKFRLTEGVKKLLTVNDAGVFQKVTGLPAPLFYRIKSGTLRTVTPKTSKILREASFKAAYKALRYTGLSVKSAKDDAKKYPLSEALEIADRMTALAEKIAVGNGLDKVKHGGQWRKRVKWVVDAYGKRKKRIVRYKTGGRANGIERATQIVLKGMAKSTRQTTGDWEAYVSQREQQRWCPMVYNPRTRRTEPLKVIRKDDINLI